MLLKYLDAKHDSYDAECWADNEALYKGGAAFRARIGRFLPQNPQEPSEVYSARKQEARYRPYVGSICDYYVAWLFSANFDVRAKNTETGKPVTELDGFYARWKEDVGEDCDLKDFLRERLKSALTTGCAHWLVVFPDDGLPRTTDKADFRSRGLGDAKLRKVDRSQIYDWQEDDDGRLLWVIVHELKHIRLNPRAGKRSTYVETWSLYDAENVETYSVTYEDGRRPKADEEIASIGIRKHGAAQVPLVSMTMPEGLCVVERCKDAQLENFALQSALTWNIKRTCYAMPVFQLTSDEKPPKMGAGYYIMIGAEEKFSWAGPPTEHLAITSEAIDTNREEIYRITHQLALSVNNHKGAAVARSGDSKEQDALSTRVMLNAFGAVVKEALEETYEILSDGRGDIDIEFSIEGLDSFDTAAVSTLIANAVAMNELGIQSATLEKDVKTRVGLAMAPDADQARKDAIRTEIEDGVDNPPEQPDGEAALHAMADRIAERASKQRGARGAIGVDPQVPETSGGKRAPATAPAS